MRIILIDKCGIICYYTGVNKIDSQIEPIKKQVPIDRCQLIFTGRCAACIK